MNRSTLRTMFGAALLLAVTGAPALAQPLGAPPSQPFSGPTVSPYLGLRPGNSAAIGLYTNVRPNQEYGSYIQQFQQNFRQIDAGGLSTQQGFTQDVNRGLPSTGQVAGFQTQSQFFMTQFRQSGTGRSAPGAAGSAGVRPPLATALPTMPQAGAGSGPALPMGSGK
jgi:hypothetical protein